MKMSNVFWAVTVCTVAMVFNPIGASAQVPNTPSAGQCAAVNAAGATIQQLCAMDMHKGCPVCVRFAPCMGSGCGGTATPTPPAPTRREVNGGTDYTCEGGGTARADGCDCPEGTAALLVGRTSRITSSSATQLVRRYTVTKRCVPTTEAVNQIRVQLTEARAELERLRKEYGDRISALEGRMSEVERRIAVLEGQLNDVRNIAVGAAIRVEQLAGDVTAVVMVIQKMETDLKAVKRFVPRMDLGYQLGVQFRGSDAGSGVTHQLVVGWTQYFGGTGDSVSAWAQGRVGYLSCDGCEPDTAGRATMYTGGAVAGIGFGFGENRDFSARIGLGFQLVAPPDTLVENGMGRSIGPELQLRYDIPGTPVFVAGAAALNAYNKQLYFGSPHVAGEDDGIGGFLGVQIGVAPKIDF